MPKEWKGVRYGGMERLAAFVDLDCRFDILRFSQLLKHQIARANSNGKKGTNDLFFKKNSSFEKKNGVGLIFCH